MPAFTELTARNYLLRAMTAADRDLLRPDLESVALPKDMVVEERDSPIEHVYFPTAGLGSVVVIAPGGEQIEAGMFGRDGMSGTAVATGAERTPLRTVMQVGGSGFRIRTEALRRAIEASPALHGLLLRYGQSLAIQTAHTALANATYPVEVRLARWLLMARDRLDADELPLTHDYLSVMLAVHRPSVTTALHVLEGDKLIRGTRGIVTIRDRAGLEAFADGSYGKPEGEYARLIGPFSR